MSIPILRRISRFTATVLFALTAFAAHAQQPAAQTSAAPIVEGVQREQTRKAPGRIEEDIDRGFYGDLSRPVGTVINRIELPRLPGGETNCDGPNKDDPACKK